jgi:GDPmannose 4,6-dehydratase
MVNYQKAYGLFVCNGILFNHESLHHGEDFLIQKIIKVVGKIKIGHQEKLYLNNLKVF